MLGEHGFSLSGGQRQRLAIARAILADPRVLILDDATSAVDPTKEHEIRAALAEVMRGRTTLIIAHRPATIALADRVVLMDEHGRVAATGTHAQLLATNEAYRRVLADVSEGHEVAHDEPRADDLDVEPPTTTTSTTTTTCATRPTSGGGRSGCCGRGVGSWSRCRCSSSVRPR